MRYAWLVVPWLVPSRFVSWAVLPWVVLSRKEKHECSGRHVVHEEQHLADMRAWLVLSPVVWLVQAVAARSWYARHPWEVRAREAADAYLLHEAPLWWRVAGWLASVLVLIVVADRLGLHP